MKNKIKFAVSLLGLFLSLSLISCGGGGNKNSSEATDDGSFDIENLSVTKVQTSASVLKSGHEGVVNVRLKSKEPKDAKNVPVSIIFMKNDETGDQQYYSGTYTIPVVTPGEESYELKINVPAIEGNFGNYNIIACLYEKWLNQYTDNGNPTDEQPEVNVNDNNDVFTTGEVDLDPTLQNKPDVQVTESIINDDVFILNTNSLSPADPADLAVQLKIIALAGDLADAKVKFYISHLDGSQRFDIQVKDSDGIPVDEISLPALIKYQEIVKGYDLVIPDSAITALKNYVKYGICSRYPFIICATVSSESEPEEFKSNNSAISNFWLVPDDSLLSENVTSKKIGFGLDRFFGNSYLGGGVKLYSYTGADKDKIYSENGFVMPVKLLKYGFNFFEASFNVRNYFNGTPNDGKTAGISIVVKRINTSFPSIGYNSYTYASNTHGEWKTDGIKDGQEILDYFKSATPGPNGSIAFNPFSGAAPSGGDLALSESYEYFAVIMVGPIPVKLTLGLTGYAGVGAFAVYEQTNLAAGLIPYCGLSAYMTGGVGVPGFEVGVKGELNMIQLSLNNFIWTEWEDVETGPNKLSKYFSLNEYSGLELNLMSGSFGVFAKYPWPKFKKVMGCPVFVGFYTKESTYYFWRSGWCYNQHYPILPKKAYSILIPLD